MKSNISVIIPVHKLTASTEAYLRKALSSVVSQTQTPASVLIVAPAKVAKKVVEITSSEEFKDVKFPFKTVVNKGETDFCTQVNLGVQNLDTTHFCILELDDELLPNWLANANKYMMCETDVDAFLPLVVNTNEGGGFIGFNNEAVWAQGFSNQLGMVDNTSLNTYQGFNIAGLVMSKETFEEYGGLKPSMKLTFVYEFLLRLTYLSAKVMVIPKIGYKHLVGREDSLMEHYRKTISADEARWWLSHAKKEYFHTSDRGITYDKQPV